jgi:hypothetical protein
VLWRSFFKLTNILKKFSRRSTGPAQPKYSFLIAQEAEIELSNLINKADTKAWPVKNIEADLNEIMKAVDIAGIRNAPITEKEAMAYAECNDYENAIKKFESLLSMEQAGFSVKALETYCDIRAKLCVKNWQSR